MARMWRFRRMMFGKEGREDASDQNEDGIS